MKNIIKSDSKRKGYLRTLVLVLFLGLGISFRAEALQISFVLGDVSAKRSKKTIPLSEESKLEDGDLILTGNKSLIVLTNKQGTRIEVKENSRLLVDKKIIESGSVSLIEGTLIAKYKKMKKGHKRKIYTPTSVCAIRGTEFTIGVSKNGRSRVQMKSGKLDLYNPAGNVQISRNQKADTTPGESPKQQIDNTTVSDWRNKNNQEHENNPSGTGDKLEKHVKLLGKSSDNNTKSIESLNSSLAALNSSVALKQSEKKLAKTEDSVADNYLLNRSANSSLDSIISNYKDKKGDIYNRFQKIKEESNRVLEQQQKNLEAINKVREAYKKAAEEIKEKYRKSVEDIKKRTNVNE